jgi:predicted Na+-dependent transporter
VNALRILAEEVANEATVVNEFEQTLLRIFILIIMFGLGAGLTPKDFSLALRRPWGLVIGWLTQFGIMPLVTYVLIVTVLGLDESLSIDFAELALVIVGLIIPVGLGMLLRKLSSNIGAVLELIGGVFGLLFIPFLIIIWVPRNWQLLLTTEWPTYVVAIGMGLVGMTAAYYLAKLIKLHPMNARTVSLETGINNGPLAIAVIVAVYIDNPGVDQILLVPALYSLFIVIISTLVTLVFRRANVAEEQKIPNLL